MNPIHAALIQGLGYNNYHVPIILPKGTNFAQIELVQLLNEHDQPLICAISAPESTNPDLDFFALIEANTSSEFCSAMKDIGSLYRDVFVVKDEPTGYTNNMPFKINTGKGSPIAQRPYRVPVAHQAEVEKQLESMQRKGIITLSKSPWASPMVVVKMNGGLRLCIDYRKLNAITKGDSFPLPSIEELLVKVHNSKLFSCLDLKGGYHQVSLDPEAKEKTAFCVNDRLYEYTRLPFGLRNAPSHFSRLMTSILSNLIGTAVLIYLDDIVVLGEIVADHTHNLICILETLRRSNLKINLTKCQFFKTSVEFLGHQVTPDGIRPVHDKVEAIRNYRRPRNPKEVSSFLGLASYYRKFIRNFASISRPLDALRRTPKFQWTEEAEQAFVMLKNSLSSDDLLSYPKFDRPFLVTCDASSTALGGVISQLDDEQKDQFHFVVEL